MRVSDVTSCTTHYLPPTLTVSRLQAGRAAGGLASDYCDEPGTGTAVSLVYCDDAGGCTFDVGGMVVREVCASVIFVNENEK